MSYLDVRAVLQNLPCHTDGGNLYMLTDVFTVRHRIIRELEPAPRSVFEFGALTGYFLVTALDAAPSIERVGWVDDESHTEGSNMLCELNLRSVRPDLLWCYSAEGVCLVEADLVQVDGDHSYQGCLSDLRAAEGLNPRWIMVDDWTADTHTDEIQIATGEWLYAERAAGREWELSEYETVNGLAILTRLR